MTALLIVVVAALLGVTVWQITKIFKLSKPVGEGDSPIANNKDNEKQGQLMLIFMVLFYAFMFYCFYEYSRFYLPESASEHGHDYDQLMFITLGVIMTVQLITQALLHYFLINIEVSKEKGLYFMPIMISWNSSGPLFRSLYWQV